jgi:hypothetical protein
MVGRQNRRTAINDNEKLKRRMTNLQALCEGSRGPREGSHRTLAIS